MRKIDMDLNVQDWKEFRVGDLFECSNGTMYDNLTAEPDENAVEYYTSSESNNGFEGYLNDYNEKDVIRVPSLTVGSRGNDAVTYYHSEPYIANQNLTVLIPKQHISQFAMFFFATVLYQEKPKYSYGRLMSKEKTRDSIIKLPIQHNPDGTPVIDADKTYSDEGYVPDWQFMEDYIKSLHSEPITTTRGTAGSLSLGADKWEEFKIPKLFNEAEIAKSADIGNLEAGNTPFVGRTDVNNGIQGYVKPISVTKGKCISISMVGTNVALYQEDDFQASQNIAILRNTNMSCISALFICTLINAEMQLKYSYGRTVGKSNIEQMILRLPIQRDAFGNPVIDPEKKYSDMGYIPDWDFMERYIDSLPYSDKIA